MVCGEVRGGKKRERVGLISRKPFLAFANIGGAVPWWFGVCLCLWALRFGLGAREITLMAYNLENYTLEGGGTTKPKPMVVRERIAKIIAEFRPDVLGLCEMGSIEAVADLRDRLRAYGLEFIDEEVVFGPDTERHLALLSRIRIAKRSSCPRVPYELNGVPQLVRRGFLDVTLQVDPACELRLVGVHLKSRLAVPEGEGEVRRREAHLLRQHVDAIFERAPDCRLVVYGDLNETREQPGVREVLGGRGTAHGLVDLAAEDELGDRWTHHWRVADLYSRIDYFMVSRALFPAIVKGSARVGRFSGWREASDHRPLLVRIRFPTGE